MVEATLNPQAQELLDAGERARMIPLAAIAPEAARSRLRGGFLSHPAGPDIFETRDLIVPGPGGGTGIRLYRANDFGERAILFLHGGGGVVNSVETHDRLCRIIASEACASVLSLDYRLAPEFKYPAPLEDCFRAWLYLVGHGNELRLDTSRAGVMGDSSGASLAFGVSALAVDLCTQVPWLQCMFYPVGDHYAAGYRSYVERGSGYSLDGATMKWFIDHYLPEEWSPTDGYLFPLRRLTLEGMPQTILSVCEFDPLRDEGNELGSRLESAGVQVEAFPAMDQMHGYAMQTSTIDAAMDLVVQISRAAGQRLGTL